MKLSIFSTLFLLLFIVTAADAKMISVAAEKVNLRSAPNINAEILWEFGKGYPLQVKTTKGNWYKVVDFEKDEGWVYRELVSRNPYLIVRKTRINIRSGPSSKYKLLGKANYGVVFKTIKQTKGWAKIQHENGLTGWVRRDLVWGF